MFEMLCALLARSQVTQRHRARVKDSLLPLHARHYTTQRVGKSETATPLLEAEEFRELSFTEVKEAEG